MLAKEAVNTNITSRVIDGGALLHKVHWDTTMTYSEVLERYVNLVRKRYGDCTVVFDGYDSPSVKDNEHSRRASSRRNVEVQFTPSMKISLKREDFLSNCTNKSRLIQMLSPMLVSDSQSIVNSKSGADTDIVKAALKLIYYCISTLFLKLFHILGCSVWSDRSCE